MFRVRIVATVFLSLTVMCLSDAAASDDLDDIFSASFEDLANMTVVSASRHEQDLMEAPASISVVTRDDILYSAPQTVPELLQYVVGMDGYTKTHTDMDVVAHGLARDESPQMLILIDGQPVNVTPYSGLQWPTLPLALDDIERIEIVRGAASSIYGADALAGVINIMTRRAADRDNQVTLNYGESGTQQYAGHVSLGLAEGWDLALTGGFCRTQDEGVQAEDQVTGAPDNWGLKDHADISSVGFRMDRCGSHHRLTSQGGFSSSDEGYNPSPGDLVVDKSLKRTLWVNNQFGLDIGMNRLNLRIGARNLWQENKKLNGGDYVYKYRVEKGVGVDTDLHYVVNSLSHQTLIVGLNTSYLAASRDIANDPPYLYDESENLLAVFAQDQLRFIEERLLLTFSGRYDKWSNFDGQFSPKAAANFYMSDRNVNVRLSYGTSFRRPGFDENFYYVSWPGGWFKGSAVDEVTEDGRIIEGRNLEPEKLASTELGIRFKIRSCLSVDVGAFRHEVENSIGYIVFHASEDELNLGFGNTDSNLILHGVEFELKSHVGNMLSGFLNYTFQEAKTKTADGVTGDWLTAPTHKVSGGLRYHGPVIVDVRARYVDEVVYAEVPGTPVASYSTIDMAASRRMGDRVMLRVSAVNLLDNAHYEYPLYTQVTRKVMGLVRISL